MLVERDRFNRRGLDRDRLSWGRLDRARFDRGRGGLNLVARLGRSDGRCRGGVGVSARRARGAQPVPEEGDSLGTGLQVRPEFP